MKFEWDKNKAKINLEKHRVPFEEAETVFEDNFTITITDDEHSLNERRLMTIRRSLAGRLLVISHIFEKKITRIISARTDQRRKKKL